MAAVDEYSYLLVHEIIGSTAQLILQVNPDGITTATDCHRVVWCPYVPENPKTLGLLLFRSLFRYCNTNFAVFFPFSQMKQVMV